MHSKVFFKSILLGGLLVILSACQSPEKVDCEPLKQAFDDYVQSSTLPITENVNSLCHGYNMSTDFSNLEPKWAVGELTVIGEISNEANELLFDGLTFKGLNQTNSMMTPLRSNEAKPYEQGKNYKIDMNNLCRSLFMLADSSSPSPIKKTFIEPIEVQCNE